MQRCIYELAELPREPVTPAQWTAIIPAAGRGSRLGYDQPKVLYPVLGRPLLDWVLDAVDAVCSRIVLVLSPEGEAAVTPVVRRRLRDRVTVAIQSVPTGMGDAVRIAAEVTRTPYALVVWGDQATLRPDTVAACAALHEARPHATLTLPTVLKHDPYIDFERDGAGRIVRVRQSREGEIERDVGENDCGLFLFSTKVLAVTLARVFTAGAGQGLLTRESNLLQVLPSFEQGPGSVATIRLSDLSETLGVNTPADAALVADVLTARAQQ